MIKTEKIVGYIGGQPLHIHMFMLVEGGVSCEFWRIIWDSDGFLVGEYIKTLVWQRISSMGVTWVFEIALQTMI